MSPVAKISILPEFWLSQGRCRTLACAEYAALRIASGIPPSMLRARPPRLASTIIVAFAVLPAACALGTTDTPNTPTIVSDPSPVATATTSAQPHEPPPPAIAPIDRTWQSCPPRHWVLSKVDSTDPNFPVSGTGVRLAPLPDGKVMVIDGDAMWGEVAVYDPVRDEYLFAPDMTTKHGIHSVPFLTDGRSNEAALTMPDGTVMLIGGSTRKESPTTEVDSIDPRTWTVRKLAPLLYTREATESRLQAILLPNGKVMAFGGNPFHPAEIYDPTNNTWTESMTPPSMVLSGFEGFPQEADVPSVLTLTPSGSLVVFGRHTACGRAYVYDVASDIWSETPPMPIAKQPDAAVTLKDGRVFAVGGNGCGASWAAFNVQLFDPRSGAWSAAAPLPTQKVAPYAELLPCGSVFVYGSESPDLEDRDLVQVYDPPSDSWSEPIGPMYRSGREASAVLADGTMIIAFSGPGPARQMVLLR